MRCFFCSNFINPDGRHVTAGIRHCYKNGGQRDSDRTFHEPCFDKFQRVGRPRNPETGYEVLWTEDVKPGSDGSDAGAVRRAYVATSVPLVAPEVVLDSSRNLEPESSEPGEHPATKAED